MNYLGFALPLALPHGFVSGAALFANLTRSEKGRNAKCQLRLEDVKKSIFAFGSICARKTSCQDAL
jgi:hypothetical protein